MNTINTTINEVKKSMPRHVLWLVMFAAFLVVVILLVLLVTKKSSYTPKAAAGELALTVEPAKIEWLSVPVGEKQTQTIKIIANEFAQFPSIKLSENIEGLAIKDSCVNMGEIAPEIPCFADLTWKPENPLTKTSVKILIAYHLADTPVEMAKTLEIPVTLSAKKEEVKPAPKSGPEPTAKPLKIAYQTPRKKARLLTNLKPH